MERSRQYLPGCYSHLPCHYDESLPGYLLRLAQSNGYSGLREFLQLVALNDAGRPLRVRLVRLRTNQSALREFSRIAVGDPPHLSPYYSDPLPVHSQATPTEALFIQDCRVDLDALFPERTAQCPHCLRDTGYLKEAWDLAPVTACSVHRCVLVDECPRCTRPFAWSRISIFNCEECGLDLRNAMTREASTESLMVACDFAALAPFRVEDARRNPLIAEWDEMFLAFKAMLLPDWRWAASEFPRDYVHQTTVADRHATIELFAKVLRRHRYEVFRLRSKAERALAPLTRLPGRHVSQNEATRFLTMDVGLSRPFAIALSRTDQPADPPSAADAYLGRPPTLYSEEDVRHFLRASAEDFSRIAHLGFITQRLQVHLGYDADELLRAKAFLDSLLDLAQLSLVVGMPVREQDLHPDGLLPRWNPQARHDHRVEMARLMELQKQLAARWHRAAAPVNGADLGSFATAMAKPFNTTVAVVSAIIAGEVARFSWKPPYAWTDLQVEQDDIRAACH